MGLLKRYLSKKFTASTLIETLVASVLIIIIFSIASMTLNNVFKASYKSNTAAIEAQLSKMIYLYQHKKIELAYNHDSNNYNFSLSKQKLHNTNYIVAEARQIKGSKSIIKSILYEGDQ